MRALGIGIECQQEGYIEQVLHNYLWSGLSYIDDLWNIIMEFKFILAIDFYIQKWAQDSRK